MKKLWLELLAMDAGKIYRKASFIFFALLLVGGIGVGVHVDQKLDTHLNEAEQRVETEVDRIWNRIVRVTEQRNFVSQFSFHVNLAAMDLINSSLRDLRIPPYIFLYDADRHYFGKSVNNELDRFSFRLRDRALKEQDFHWTFTEIQGQRYIERFHEIRSEGRVLGYLRVLLSLKDLQNQILSAANDRTHLTVETHRYGSVRCSLSQSTDLFLCIPVDIQTIFFLAGNRIYAFLLSWILLLFLLLFYLSSKAARAKAAALAELSSQVSHDIQSPLLALRMATKDMQGLGPTQSLMVQRALDRIEDIVNDLKNKRDMNQTMDGSASIHLLYGIVSSILSEKRLQYKYRQIEMDLFVAPAAIQTFVQLDQRQLKRVLSNLINNAAESIDHYGNIGIEMEVLKHQVQITIIDTGKGIAAEILAQVFEKEFSHGKENGQGLGLYHAKQQVNKWGGEIRILSVPQRGTKVILSLPMVDKPGWFVEPLSIQKDQVLVVVDDDENIHQLWREILRERGIGNPLRSFYHLEIPSGELHALRDSGAVFLVDYELVHSHQTGMDFILQNKLQKQAVLVTARHDDERILRQCVASGVRLLPKLLMSEYLIFSLPLDVTVEQASSHGGISALSVSLTDEVIVLIDDDPLVRKVWSLAAAKKPGVKFLSFASPEDFSRSASTIDTGAKIFVDVDLGSQRGDEWSSHLPAMGFSQIYLATGFVDIDTGDKPWLLGVHSKTPPF